MYEDPVWPPVRPWVGMATLLWAVAATLLWFGATTTDEDTCADAAQCVVHACTLVAQDGGTTYGPCLCSWFDGLATTYRCGPLARSALGTLYVTTATFAGFVATLWTWWTVRHER